MVKQLVRSAARKLVHRTLVSVGSLGMTLLLFCLLPVINEIASGERTDTVIVPVDTAELPPPPDLIEEEEIEEEEPDEEEPPPELSDDAEPLDLAQLEMALNADFGDGGLGGDFSIDLGQVTGKSGGVDELFAASELDGKPQATSMPHPSLNRPERKATPGKVVVIFIVDKSGRVVDPRIQKSSNQILNSAALRTVKKWRFQPGTRKGEPVRFRMRVPMTFPKQQ